MGYRIDVYWNNKFSRQSNKMLLCQCIALTKFLRLVRSLFKIVGQARSQSRHLVVTFDHDNIHWISLDSNCMA